MAGALEIEITPEMVAAGLAAWRAESGDEFPLLAMGNDETLIAEIRAAGDRVGQRVWPLPMYDEYREQIKSDYADMKNSGGRAAGTITAAWFLGGFVGISEDARTLGLRPEIGWAVRQAGPLPPPAGSSPTA